MWGEKRYHSLDYALKSSLERKYIDCIERRYDLSEP